MSVAEASRLIDDPLHHASMARAPNPFGDGRARSRIVEHPETFLGCSSPGRAADTSAGPFS